MTSLATAIGGMKHWDWCPICRGGLDTGLECDQCGADLMPVYKAFKDLQARPSDSVVLRAIKARADRSRLGYGGKAWVTSDPKSEVVEDRMLLVEIVCRQEFAINRLRAALNEAADSFKNVGLSVDAENCEEAINESLSGGNPSEPKACTGAEERGISGATGAGQLPDGNPESTGDSADRRSPDGTARTPSPDESNRHFERGCHVIMELMQAYERRVRSDCTTQEQLDKRPWECAEYIKAAEYLRKVWPPHEPGASRLADDEGIVCVLASHLAKCDGHDDPNHLIWEGGPIPEPWGEVWCRYEEPAKEILRLIDGCLTPKGSEPQTKEGTP